MRFFPFTSGATSQSKSSGLRCAADAYESMQTTPAQLPQRSLRIRQNCSGPAGSMTRSNQLLLGHHRRSRLLAVDIILKLLAKLLHESQRRHGRRIAQRAERPAHHVLGQVLHVLDVLLLPAALIHARQRLLDPIRAFAARNAPAATLVLVELD